MEHFEGIISARGSISTNLISQKLFHKAVSIRHYRPSLLITLFDTAVLFKVESVTPLVLYSAY